MCMLSISYDTNHDKNNNNKLCLYSYHLDVRQFCLIKLKEFHSIICHFFLLKFNLKYVQLLLSIDNEILNCDLN